MSSSDHPDVGRVTGTVTLDGSPLVNAVLTFEPLEEGRPSYGRTDESGEYKLYYTDDDPGAIIGKHRVRITTADSGNEDEGVCAYAGEKLPMKYNVRTELEEEVTGGSQTINFELSSEGEVAKESKNR